MVLCHLFASYKITRTSEYLKSRSNTKQFQSQMLIFLNMINEYKVFTLNIALNTCESIRPPHEVSTIHVACVNLRDGSPNSPHACITYVHTFCIETSNFTFVCWRWSYGPLHTQDRRPLTMAI